jgi:hypothetical protein
MWTYSCSDLWILCKLDARLFVNVSAFTPLASFGCLLSSSPAHRALSRQRCRRGLFQAPSLGEDSAKDLNRLIAEDSATLPHRLMQIGTVDWKVFV